MGGTAPTSSPSASEWAFYLGLWLTSSPGIFEIVERHFVADGTVIPTSAQEEGSHA